MTNDASQIEFLTRPNAPRLAYRFTKGAADAPTLVWCGGFRSDMEGGKAIHLHAWAQKAGYSFLRFDYSGHGSSEGAFADGTIGQWRDDATAVIEAIAPGPRVLVGSSMGGWVSLLLARAQQEKIAGLVLIAPAPDFTERLMWPGLTDEQRAEITEKGRTILPSPYDPDGDVITLKLIENGRDNLLLTDGSIPYRGPVRILHGMLDDAVPWRLSLELTDALASTDVETHFIKSGDHRLSEPNDLDRLARTTSALMLQLTAGSA